MILTVSNLEAVAATGEKIYEKNYKKAFETKHFGKFVEIDVNTGEAYLGKSSGEALRKAVKNAPSGVFHLIRIGYPAAYSVRSLRCHH